MEIMGQHVNQLSVDRVDWIDYAKGICIVWVVTLYATNFVQEQTDSIGWMQHAVNFARPFRMPDLFLLSGLFVGRVIRRPWRIYVDSKVLHFFYFYALWVSLKFVNQAGTGLFGADAASLLPDYLALYIQPPSGPLWFIYMLALFFVIVRLLRSVPKIFVMSAAIALEVPDIVTGIKIIDKFADYFVFFYTGYVFAPYVFRAAKWAESHLRSAGLILLLWFAANAALVEYGFSFQPGIELLMGYAGASAVMLLATLLCGVSWMSWLRYLGKNSIVVYLGFVVPLGLMRRFIANPALNIDTGFLSLGVTIASILGAVLLYWVIRKTPLSFMYVRPEWLSFAKRRSFNIEEQPEGAV